VTVDEATVQHLAALAGLEIPAARMPEVVANLRRTSEVAAFVGEVALDPMADELAPVWRP
jgi:hypothetical protein